ncbi:hypothetical protein DV532_27000 (plasmid) [Pseudomonas sp. Leaf58]|uniref:hypothetical protein n=1 Tax=Pseudomonas sp. Leaf58 TaxID=1736226 RepID=UPI0006FC5EE7|nr:hypothetical protein [Pseudomonas sp. Leaf58]AYG47933.1 hypothetical protein DV532_27000 [Pseudomonas sp. Leaf58]KQN62504.1 hypothetical protein ASF02_10170 [Pseudomonas sp. Leaf58]
MNLIKTLPLVFALIVGAAHAEPNNVVISIDAPGLSSALTTQVGRSATVSSGELQSPPSQALCITMDVNPAEGPDKLSVVLNTVSATTVTVLPTNSDATGVRAYVGFTEQALKDQKLVAASKDCTLPTGMTSSTTKSMFVEFVWGEPKKIDLPDGQALSITINNPEAAGQ